MYRIGMITPSSNTILEPSTVQMAAPLEDLTVHFSRFRVTEISLSEYGITQFDTDAMLPAASLLADARVDCIVWNGTSAGWLGIDSDRALCSKIEDSLGVPASTTVLAQEHAFQRLGVRRLHMITPYTDDVNEAIRSTFVASGLDVAAISSFDQSENWGFSTILPSQVSDRASELMDIDAEVDAVYSFCTNMNAAVIAPKFEATYRPAFIDTVALSLWEGLRLCGYPDSSPLAPRWGRLFLA